MKHTAESAVKAETPITFSARSGSSTNPVFRHRRSGET
jgi:hypothetical protein